MKKKILLFTTLFSSVFTFSQINVAESFESGIQMNWTTFTQNVNNSIGLNTTTSNTCQGNNSISTIISSSNTYAGIKTPSYVSTGKPIEVSFQYRLNNIGMTVVPKIFYSISFGANVEIPVTNILNDCNTVSGTIPANVIPNGTLIQIIFQFEYNSGNGLSYMDNILIKQESNIVLIAEYLFNNNLTNTSGNSAFDNFVTSSLSFAQDRAAISNNALRIGSGGKTRASISGLPIGAGSRTVSVWIRPTSMLTNNIIFSFGSNQSTSHIYSGSFNNSRIRSASFASNFEYATTNVINVWKHIVFTYDAPSGKAKIYVDGQFKKEGDLYLVTGNDGSFYLGSELGGTGLYQGDIDDLKIYGGSLSASQVQELYTNNTLSSQHFNQNNLEVSLYPNPANDVLNIEMSNEVKSIDIYNIQGQKVKSSNQKQINILDLAAGVYLIRIQDAENAVSTKKFVKQ